MTSFRTANGGLIDRTKTLKFEFDGKTFTGHPGDTLASALKANGVSIIGRSFKYHRPRGFWGAWFDDPNGVFDISLNGNATPNCAATTTYLQDGMKVRAVNATPSASFDIKGILDKFHRFLPAGFYYKTFMWPSWHVFEHFIRNAAGMGRLDGREIEQYCSEQTNDRCDLLVIGGGAAGLAAARVAAENGKSVIIVDDHDKFGGGLYAHAEPVETKAPADWASEQTSAIKNAGGRLLSGTTAFGVYDHGLVALSQERGFAIAPRLWRIRAGQILIATGAIDRPITFANNDRPGVMSLAGATEFLGRYGVLAGKNIAILSNNTRAEAASKLLQEAGADVRLLDAAKGSAKAIGSRAVNAVEQAGQSIPCDALLVSGGLTPLVHLWRHAGGKLDWDDKKAAFIPGKPPKNMIAAGAANGTFDLEQALQEARSLALGKSVKPAKSVYEITPVWPEPHTPGRQWIDFQHDVTLKDIELAARENYVSVEHLKRYTTLGMAGDQGKTSNMAGLAAMAAIQGKSIPETGTTTFRPPFVPVPLELYRGARRDELFNPLKRLNLANEHDSLAGVMREYGGWLRPAFYGDGDEPEEIKREAVMVRNAGGIFDGSPLGKIEVLGPDAEKFVNFIYYNTIKTLKPGHIRYGFMLTERGVVYNDGVISRLDKNRFIISCSSSHVDGVSAMLETWRQDGNDPDKVFIHDTTHNWSTITITGPKARQVLQALELGIDVSAKAFAHMTFQNATFDGAPARISRVSFSGDISFEISLPNANAQKLWTTALDIGKPLGIGPVGLEAMSLLRAEKGYVIIGKDTDGTTMPHDLGFGIPRQKKTATFIGDRSLHTTDANHTNRRQLVGLAVPRGSPALPTGAHIVVDTPPRSIGYVTSSYDSPTLGHPIALALVENGFESIGHHITIWHLNHARPATIVSPVFFDPQGERLHG